jgi:hypothetical protein
MTLIPRLFLEHNIPTSAANLYLSPASYNGHRAPLAALVLLLLLRRRRWLARQWPRCAAKASSQSIYAGIRGGRLCYWKAPRVAIALAMISAHVVNLSAASGFVGNVSRAALRNAITARAGLSRAATSASDTRANSEGLNSASALRMAVIGSVVMVATIQCRVPPGTRWTGRRASRDATAGI